MTHKRKKGPQKEQNAGLCRVRLAVLFGYFFFLMPLLLFSGWCVDMTNRERERVEKGQKKKINVGGVEVGLTCWWLSGVR
jgi:flagellar biogenesis protein FliO